MAALKIKLNEIRSLISKVLTEEYLNNWDALYEQAHQEPNKTKIKKALVQIFKDPHVMGLVGDNYHWSDGSNGVINFSNLNHYITDIGYKCFADNPELFNDLLKLKQHILYSYATSESNLQNPRVNTKYYYEFKKEHTIPMRIFLGN
jgi:hypothetical protein